MMVNSFTLKTNKRFIWIWLSMEGDNPCAIRKLGGILNSKEKQVGNAS